MMHQAWKGDKQNSLLSPSNKHDSQSSQLGKQCDNHSGKKREKSLRFSAIITGASRGGSPETMSGLPRSLLAWSRLAACERLASTMLFGKNCAEYIAAASYTP